MLLLVPAGLRDQWQSRSSANASASRRRSSTWQAHVVVLLACRSASIRGPRFPSPLTSIDYAKRPEVLPTLLQCHWDVVVVDEAHGITPRQRPPSSGRCAGRARLLCRASHGDTAQRRSRRIRRALQPGQDERRGSAAGVSTAPGRRRARTRPGECIASTSVHRLPSGACAERLEQFSRALELERRADPAAALTLTMLHERALSSARSLRDLRQAPYRCSRLVRRQSVRTARTSLGRSRR